MPADGVALREERAGERRVDDGDGSGRERIGGGEIPAGDQLDLERVEVGRLDAVDAGGGFLSRLGSLPALDQDRAVAEISEKRQRPGDGDMLGARQRRQTLLEPRIERVALLRGCILGLRQGEDAPGERMMIPAGIDRQELVDAGDDEAGAGQKHERVGKLQHDQAVAKAMLHAVAGGAAGADLERFIDPGARNEPGRRQAEDHAGEQRQGEREGEDLPVERQRGIHKAVRRELAREPLVGPHGDQDAEGAAAHGQQHAFGERGAQQARAGGAERGADGVLVAAGKGAGELEVGEIAAGDEQHEAGEREQHHGGADGGRIARGRLEGDGAQAIVGMLLGPQGAEVSRRWFANAC